ncbi:MAG: hypothetical protein Q7R79_03140 [bacterium]|nr:hypothetical protein [bacterium]
MKKESEFVNTEPISDEMEVLWLLYHPYRSNSVRRVFAFPEEEPHVGISYYGDRHGICPLLDQKKYLISSEVLKKLKEARYITPDESSYDLELSEKGYQAYIKELARREQQSYYGRTCGHIRWKLRERYLDVSSDKSAMGENLPAYLLWMVNEIETMDRTSAKACTKAGRWIGWVLSKVEDLGLWDNEKSRDFTREDVVAGRDLPMAKACPFCSVPRVEEKHHG